MPKFQPWVRIPKEELVEVHSVYGRKYFVNRKELERVRPSVDLIRTYNAEGEAMLEEDNAWIARANIRTAEVSPERVALEGLLPMLDSIHKAAAGQLDGWAMISEEHSFELLTIVMRGLKAGDEEAADKEAGAKRGLSASAGNGAQIPVIRSESI